MPNDNDAMSQKGPRPSDAKRIERHAFDTASLSEAEALQQFQHLVMAPGWIEPQSLPLAVRVVTYWLADSRLRVFESTPYRVTRSAEKIASDRLDHIIVTYVIEGSVRGDCDGRTFEAPPGAVYLHDFSRPTWVEGVPDARVKLYRYAMFGLTRPIASRWFGTLAALHGAVLLSEQAPELSQWMRSLVARVETMTVAEAPRELDATMERLAFALAPQIAGTLPAEYVAGVVGTCAAAD
ncbi:MAG: AraC family ligand binding domain-containing protein [Pseudolabrys sp.]